ncbi:hypothetical protein ACNRD9_11955, partial [Ralstonia pseudosolanacearum]|uniref:hypothetical protein n=1 Tax=Ralstonia pseudosolanacearum TaxID=1310165 RepID=UPI003AB0FEDE
LVKNIMLEKRVVDVNTLLEDLRMAVAYASRAGLLYDRGLVNILKAAETTVRNDKPPDVGAVTFAINEIVKIIAPITLSDLRCGRNPLEENNQTRLRKIQFCLSIFVPILLIIIVYSANILSREQEALSGLAEIATINPEIKLGALRKMAQERSARPNPDPDRAAYEDYQNRKVELRKMIDRINEVNAFVRETTGEGQLPIWEVIRGYFGISTAGAMVPDTSTAGKTAELSSGLVQSPDICAQDASGRLKLSPEAENLLEWVRSAKSESLEDDCFLLEVVYASSQEPPPLTVAVNAANALNYMSTLKNSVAMRATWLMPFLYGLLGAMIFVMRNITSERRPAMEVFPMIVRLSLGGLAGIVIGWFSASVGTGSPAVSSNILSLPLVLAFLTGYGIDVFFSLLDRLSGSLIEPQRDKAS